MKIDERTFRSWCAIQGLPRPEPEYRILADRKFRWDWAWPAAKVAIEQQGGVWTRGAHGRGTGIVRDYEKMNLAVVAGWRVLQVQPKDLMTTQTADWLRQLMTERAPGAMEG